MTLVAATRADRRPPRPTASSVYSRYRAIARGVHASSPSDRARTSARTRPRRPNESPLNYGRGPIARHPVRGARASLVRRIPPRVSRVTSRERRPRRSGRERPRDPILGGVGGARGARPAAPSVVTTVAINGNISDGAPRHRQLNLDDLGRGRDRLRATRARRPARRHRRQRVQEASCRRAETSTIGQLGARTLTGVTGRASATSTSLDSQDGAAARDQQATTRSSAIGRERTTQTGG